MRTDYYRNKKTDQEMRGQSYTDPTTWYIALLSAASRSGGTRVTTAGVAVVPLACSLANWAGTQSAGSTAASSGTSGVTTPNVEIEFADTGDTSVPVSASYVGFYDADPTGSANLCKYYEIRDGGGSPITRNWAAGERIYIDNASPTLSIEMT